VFRDRQKLNGQIIEYVDMESGVWSDYGLNVADNTPLYLWAIWHHWQQYQEVSFLDEFLPSVRAGGDHLLREIGKNDLIRSIPNGVATEGITSWRNIIPDTVIAGEVTEINAWSALALRLAADVSGDERYRAGAERIAQAVNQTLWLGDHYALNRFDAKVNPQMTGDNLFPLLADIANADQRQRVLDRLGQPDFWTPRGLRTVPNSDPAYHPNFGFGLVGGSWPNLTLWYAAAMARHDPDRALAALEMVAQPVVEASNPDINVIHSEFPEYFDGDSGINRGMHLSPWVAPTFIWAVLEGLLGLTWKSGQAEFSPHWPTGWNEVRIRNLPSSGGAADVVLTRT
jgi:glycogen debranching enzyme